MPAACDGLPSASAGAPVRASGPGTAAGQSAGVGAASPAGGPPFLQALVNAAAPAAEGLESLVGDATAVVESSNEPESTPAPAKDTAPSDDLTQLLAALLPGFGTQPPGLPLPLPPLTASIEVATASPARTDADQGDGGTIAASVGLMALAGVPADPVASQSSAGSENTTPKLPAGTGNALELFALLEQPVERSAHSDTSHGASPDAPAANAQAAQVPPPVPSLVDPTQSAALAALHPAVSHGGTAQPTPSTVLSAPVGTPAWTDELGGHVTWMAQRGTDSASLTVSPADLGPIEVRISIHSGGQASVWFGAAHSETRTALEQALPRLRELFAAQGMSLADSGVYREAPRQFTPSAQVSKPLGSSGDEPAAQSVTAVTRTRLGLLDLYA